jgi:hypothetical protein
MCRPQAMLAGRGLYDVDLKRPGRRPTLRAIIWGSAEMPEGMLDGARRSREFAGARSSGGRRPMPKGFRSVGMGEWPDRWCSRRPSINHSKRLYCFGGSGRGQIDLTVISPVNARGSVLESASSSHWWRPCVSLMNSSADSGISLLVLIQPWTSWQSLPTIH